jgi:intein/homing endonuclease
MNLDIETKIQLNKFVPRPYQRPICDAFENKHFKKLICVMPRRCISGNTHITMSDGSWKFLKDVVPGDKVLSWDGNKLVTDIVKDVWSTGIKKTKSVRSGSYLPVVTSDNHVFASTTSISSCVSWLEISKTNKHRSLLQYAGIKSGLLHDLRVAEFLGFMLSDGYCSGDQQAKFTNINTDILDRVECLTKELFDIKVRRIPNGNAFDLRFSNGTTGGGAFKNPVKEFFKLHDINMQKSVRRLPAIIWSFDEQSILCFFSALISGDGNIFAHAEGFTAKDTGHEINPSVEITLNCGQSYLYGWDIYWLLRKIGIVSQVPYLEKQSNWKIKIAKGLGVRKLLSATTICGKVDAQKKALDATQFITKSTKIIKGCFRSRFKIHDLDEEELYDLETETHHNFIANGYLVHNSGKDIVAWNLMIRAAIRRVGLYVYALPSAVQARRVLFDGITLSGQKFLDFIPHELIQSINIQQMKVTLINNSTIIFTGSENYDALRGTNPLGVVISEAAYTHPQFYPTIRPALLASDGFVILISTPFGENHFYTLYQIAKDNPDDWYSCFMTINDTNHVSAEEIEREIESGEISPDMAEQEYRCFPAGQSVLMSDGVKNIEDVKPDDLCISHSGRIRKVLGVISSHYDGDLIEISSYGSSEVIKCTPNHPIRILDATTQTYSWKNAGSITEKDLLVFPKMIIKNNFSLVSYELCMLIAWYITEGSSFQNGLAYSVGKEEEVERVTLLLSKLNTEYSLMSVENSKCVNIVVYNTQLVDFFKSFCGTQSNNKYIPFSLISGFEEEFFFELMKGDGCYSESGYSKKYSYTTVSKSLAYQVQILANSLPMGFAAGITERAPYIGNIEGRFVNCQRSYSVQITIPPVGRKVKHNWLRRAKNGIGAKIKSIGKSHYSGTVYNFQVQYDESYVIAGRAVHNCSFGIGAIGAYYATYLNRMELNNQVGLVDWEPNYPVHSAWDIGVRDSTAILMFQVIGRQVNIIDMYQKSDVGLEHYINVLQNKPYTWGKHIAPHDIAVREFTSGGLSRFEKAAQLGIKFIIAPNISIMDGIESVRTTLPRVYVDNNRCKTLVAALRNYRKQYDAATKTYKPQPLHDENSHICFTSDTLVLTHTGMRQIIDLDDGDKVLTLRGWSKCTKAIKTKENVSIVEVLFKDGTRVKCTPDHLFLTESGWKSAESLMKGSLIQSTLTESLNILTEFCIKNGLERDIIQEVGIDCIETFGDQLLEKSLKIRIFITGIITLITTRFQILNVSILLSILNYLDLIVKDLVEKHGMRLLNGIDLKMVDCGIEDMLKNMQCGKNLNESLETVCIALKSLTALLEKSISKSFVTQIAKPLIIESVSLLQNKEDVWDISVPDFHHFSLSNGAIVHNCDALRYLCLTLPKVQNQSNPEALERRFNEAVYGNPDISKSNFFNDPVDRY